MNANADWLDFAPPKPRGFGRAFALAIAAHLVLVADPQTLGQMRPQLHKETLQRMHGELAKTFTNSPVHDIERALS